MVLAPDLCVKDICVSWAGEFAANHDLCAHPSTV